MIFYIGYFDDFTNEIAERTSSTDRPTAPPTRIGITQTNLYGMHCTAQPMLNCKAEIYLVELA